MSCLVRDLRREEDPRRMVGREAHESARRVECGRLAHAVVADGGHERVATRLVHRLLGQVGVVTTRAVGQVALDRLEPERERPHLAEEVLLVEQVWLDGERRV